MKVSQQWWLGTNVIRKRLSALDLIEWADIIFVMERSHRNKVSKIQGSTQRKEIGLFGYSR